MTQLFLAQTPARSLGRRALASIFAGCLVVVSFPPMSFGPLLVLAPAIFLWAVEGARFRQRLLLGWLMGLAIEGGGFYWIAYAAGGYGQFLVGGDLAGGPAFSLGALVFLAWLVGAALLWAAWGGMLALDRGPLGWRAWWPAMSLTFLEAVFPRVFPWNLGAGLSDWPSLLQGARLVGVAGVTTGLVLLGTLLFEALCAHAHAGRRRAWSFVMVAVAFGGAWAIAGNLRIACSDAGATELRVGYVQPDISLAERYSPEADGPQKVLIRLSRLTSELPPRSVHVAVWSEGIVPGAYDAADLARGVSLRKRTDGEVRFQAHLRTAMTQLLGRLNVPLIVGGTGPGGENRAFLVRPGLDGSAREFDVDVYDKRYLLAFGERFPLRGLASSLGFQVPRDMAKGDEVKVWRLNDADIGISICFEAVLEETGRELVAHGARAHINITEDLWFGRTSEPFQHLGLARARAVEAGLPLVRVTNAGLSAAVDRFGRICGLVPLGQKAAGVFVVPIPDQVPPPPATQRVGLLLAALCPVLLLARLVGRVRRSRSATTR